MGIIEAPFWQTAIMLTCIFALCSVVLHVLGSLVSDREAMKINNIMIGNNYLVEQIAMLQKEITNLNKELVLLTAENRALHVEVGALTDKVSRLQEQVTYK